MNAAPTSSPVADGDVRDCSGFSLMEAVVATVIAVVAALGLAYSFGIGRTNVNRFEMARGADALAQSRMEMIGVLAEERPTSDSLHVGLHPSPTNDFTYHGRVIGQEYWRVEPAPNTVPATIRANLVRVTTTVAWSVGGLADSVTYTRLVAK